MQAGQCQSRCGVISNHASNLLAGCVALHTHLLFTHALEHVNWQYVQCHMQHTDTLVVLTICCAGKVLLQSRFLSPATMLITGRLNTVLNTVA